MKRSWFFPVKFRKSAAVRETFCFLVNSGSRKAERENEFGVLKDFFKKEFFAK